MTRGTRDEGGREILRSLPAIERLFCGPLNIRQLDYGSRREKELEIYGPKGSVLLCSARAIETYALGFAVMAMGFAIAGMARVAIAIFIILCLVATFAVIRSVNAGNYGRQWRDEHSN